MSEEDSDHEISQVILDTSHNSVYDNRLRVRGRIAGIYTYIITSAYPFAEHSQVIVGIDNLFSKQQKNNPLLVAGQPTRLNTVISGSNATHVNVTASWESPGGDVSGYIIYYQTEGGPVISDEVSG